MHQVGGRTPTAGSADYARHVRGKRGGSDTSATPSRPRKRGSRSQGNRGTYSKLSLASLMILKGDLEFSKGRRKGSSVPQKNTSNSGSPRPGGTFSGGSPKGS